MKVCLAGRAAEQVVFGRVTNGAANDLEKVTELARSMVFECGMSDTRHVPHDARRQLRALGGDEAAPRLRAGAADRRRVRGGRRLLRSTAPRSTGSRTRCSRRRRSSATSSWRCSSTSRAESSASETVGTRRASSLASHRSSIDSGMDARGIHHVGVAVRTSTRRVATYRGSSAPSSSIASTSPTRASRPWPCSSAAAGSSCSRRWPRTRRSAGSWPSAVGDAPRRLRGRRLGTALGELTGQAPS